MRSASSLTEVCQCTRDGSQRPSLVTLSSCLVVQIPLGFSTPHCNGCLVSLRRLPQHAQLGCNGFPALFWRRSCFDTVVGEAARAYLPMSYSVTVGMLSAVVDANITNYIFSRNFHLWRANDALFAGTNPSARHMSLITRLVAMLAQGC